MAMTELGKPFDGIIYYWIEDTYGVVTDITTCSLPISCKVQDVRIDSGDRHKTLRSIESPLVCNFLPQTNEPKLHLEYIPQTDDTMIDTVIDRVGSCCSLQSLSFAIGFNKCKTGIDSSWFRVTGAKPSTVRITGSKNTEYMVVIDYEAKSIVSVGSDEVGSAPSELTGGYCAFNIAGEIRKTGGLIVNADHIAFITNSIDITVNHNLQGQTDHDSLLKSYLIEGAMDIEGSVDITLDGGGAQHYGEVLANTAFEIEVDLSNTVGAPRITLPGCEWKNTSLDKSISGEAMSSSVPFDAKPTSCSLIVATVPAP